MKTYFLNKKNLKNSKSTNLIYPVISGRYGNYAKTRFGNQSEKRMLQDGFSLIELSSKEANRIITLETKRSKRLQKEYQAKKLQDRANAIDICLTEKPLDILDNDGGNPFVSYVVNLSGTKMIEAYSGCGKGTAYINEDNKLVAFHYGYEKPKNAPKLKSVRVELSCTQICI